MKKIISLFKRDYGGESPKGLGNRLCYDEIVEGAEWVVAGEGIATRVVSMPCTNVFDRQSADYKSAVLGGCKKRIAIEAAHPDFWHKYVGLHGAVIGIDRFGESAPAGQLFDMFGFTVANVVKTAKALLS